MTPTQARNSKAKPRRRYAARMPPEQRREQLIDAALGVILEEGYGGVSIEAIARSAGVTRPVVYDHFSNLGELLQSLVEREERYSLEQLAEVVPLVPETLDPVEALAGGVRRFLEIVAARPATWRLILLPLDGTPALVRQHVESNRANILSRIEELVHASAAQWQLAADFDLELAARTIRDLGEDAGRLVLTDPDRFSPDRFERFVKNVLCLLVTGHGAETAASSGAESA